MFVTCNKCKNSTEIVGHIGIRLNKIFCFLCAIDNGGTIKAKRLGNGYYELP